MFPQMKMQTLALVVTDLGCPACLTCNWRLKSDPMLVNGGAICTLSADKGAIFCSTG